MIKDLVVNLSVAEGRDPAAEFALSVGSMFESHILGMAFEYVYAPSLPETDGFGWRDALATMQRESQEAAQKAITRFASAAPLARTVETHMAKAAVLDAGRVFSAVARRFDLSIVLQPRASGIGEDAILDGALFDTGRPTLVVPYIQQQGLSLDRVLVCWDGSRAAARAIGDAMPFLARAKDVNILTIADSMKSDDLPAADIATHLARHNVRAEIESMVLSDIDVADAVLSHTVDISASLVVMGAYGHPKIREFLLGGTTKKMLETMTVPVLMSH
jgi:nucleotide-binding universal stress UspA family protein